MQGEFEKLDSLLKETAQNSFDVLDYCLQNKISAPKLLTVANEYVLKNQLKNLFSGKFEGYEIYKYTQKIMELKDSYGFSVDISDQKISIEKFLLTVLKKYFEHPDSKAFLAEFIYTFKAILLLPININLWRIRNQWYYFLSDTHKIKNTPLFKMFEEINELLNID